MKTNKKIFLAQIALFILLILPLTTIVSGCQNNESVDLDVTESQWELLLITQNNVEFHKPIDNFQNPDAYILRFDNDSIFTLNTSVNSAKGKFSIDLEAKSIVISNYHELTEVAASDINEQSLNDLLINSINYVSSYEQINTHLTLKGNFGEIKFEKIQILQDLCDIIISANNSVVIFACSSAETNNIIDMLNVQENLYTNVYYLVKAENGIIDTLFYTPDKGIIKFTDLKNGTDYVLIE